MSDPATAYAALIAVRLGHRRHNVGLRVAALAHVLDRAADMLAVPLDRTPGRIREVLDDPERVRAAMTHADSEGADLLYGDEPPE